MPPMVTPDPAIAGRPAPLWVHRSYAAAYPHRVAVGTGSPVPLPTPERLRGSRSGDAGASGHKRPLLTRPICITALLRGVAAPPHARYSRVTGCDAAVAAL